MATADTSSGKLILLGQPIDLRQSLVDLCREQRSLLMLLGVTMVLDALSTIAFMATAGIDIEHNLLVRALAHSLGIVAGTALGKLPQLVAALALSTLAPRLARFIFSTVILMNLGAFVVNMHVFGIHW